MSREAISLYPWNALPTIPVTPTKKAVPARDPLRLARYYQSLFDGGEFKTRDEVARFLGVSRARVTQVLNRLNSHNSNLPITDSA
jgi:hypothetical protein